MPKYIDADALERKLMSLGEDVICDDCLLEVLAVLDHFPTESVEPKRKTGVWIRCGEPDSDRNIRFECSVCHAGDVHAEGMNVPYCWQCGSEMQGETKGEEE